MFDWNDEEISNIIWDEAGETDDHIVPYPGEDEGRPPGLRGDHFKKESNQEATNSKPAEHTKTTAKSDYSGVKQESSLKRDTSEGNSAPGYRMERWPLSHAARTDQDSMGTEISNNLTEITKFDSSRGDETSQLDNDSEIFQNQPEDKEQSDFVDYSWANIGSFDDLDRIFSNDDSIFGHASLGNSDQLWSSSEDVNSTSGKSFPLSTESPSLGLGSLRRTPGQFEIKSEYVQDQEISFTHSFGKMNHLSSQQQNLQVSTDQVGCVADQTKPVAKGKTEEIPGKTFAFNSHIVAENIKTHNEFADKMANQKKILKNPKRSGGLEGQQLQESCSTWSPRGKQFQQFGQLAPSMPQAPVLSQQTKLQQSTQYQSSPNSFVAPSVYGSIKNPYAPMISLPKIHCGEDNQSVLSGYAVSPRSANPLSRSPGTSMKPQIMTPQEKIEKLRRRQQMQALLAIQRQQQQFSHQISNNDQTVVQKCQQENQVLQMQGGNSGIEENISTLSSIDPNSPIELEDANEMSEAVDDYYSVEDVILHRLQDTIAKLDIRIRLFIRDSLFRLAQSAMQRQYASDTSSTNKNSRDEIEVLTKEETSNRFTQMPNMETETNPIDRTVAHLLFHRPMESPGIHSEAPESPSSTRLLQEGNTPGLLSSPRGVFPDNYKSKQNLSFHESKNPRLYAEGDQSKSSPCMDTSENMSTNETTDA
ncbi:hypothetical protein NMG60_11023480 [Bertholletia excelsa]